MKHFLPTRRKKTLRRLLALVLLLGFMALCGYGFTPHAAVKALGERWLLEGLETVAYLRPQIRGGQLQIPILAENEYELLFTTACFLPRSGWYSGVTEGTLQTGAAVTGFVRNDFYSDGIGSGSYSYLCGKITDSRIVRWELEASPLRLSGSNSPAVPIPLPLGREQWIETDGSRYFLLDVDLNALYRAMGDGFFDVTTRCYDSGGELVEELLLGAVTVNGD